MAGHEGTGYPVSCEEIDVSVADARVAGHVTRSCVTRLDVVSLVSVGRDGQAPGR